MNRDSILRPAALAVLAAVIVAAAMHFWFGASGLTIAATVAAVAAFVAAGSRVANGTAGLLTAGLSALVSAAVGAVVGAIATICGAVLIWGVAVSIPAPPSLVLDALMTLAVFVGAGLSVALTLAIISLVRSR